MALMARSLWIAPPVPPVVADGRTLTIDAVAAVARGARVVITDDPDVRRAVEASRDLKLDLIDQGVPLYGVTTGFGDSVRRQISPEKADRLQLHLVRMLGTGTGAPASEPFAREVLSARANN